MIDGLVIFILLTTFLWGNTKGNVSIGKDVFSISVVVILILLFKSMSLITIIDNKGIHLKLFPIMLKYKTIRFEDVMDVELISIKPLKDYGGYGIRISRKGTAYIMSSNKGIRIIRNEGSPVFIGSEKPEKLYDLVKSKVG